MVIASLIYCVVTLFIIKKMAVRFAYRLQNTPRSEEKEIFISRSGDGRDFISRSDAAMQGLGDVSQLGIFLFRAAGMEEEIYISQARRGGEILISRKGENLVGRF